MQFVHVWWHYKKTNLAMSFIDCTFSHQMCDEWSVYVSLQTTYYVHEFRVRMLNLPTYWTNIKTLQTMNDDVAFFAGCIFWKFIFSIHFDRCLITFESFNKRDECVLTPFCPHLWLVKDRRKSFLATLSTRSL